MRPAPTLLVLGIALLGAACASVCPQKQPLLASDGGQLTCVQHTDCPRPSNVLVCSNTADQLRDCVACLDSLCVRYVPKECP